MSFASFSRLRFVRVPGQAVERICDPQGISGGRAFEYANWLDMEHIMFPSIDADGIHWRLIVIRVRTKVVAFHDPLGSPDREGDCDAVLQWLQWVIVHYPDTHGRHPRAANCGGSPEPVRSGLARGAVLCRVKHREYRWASQPSDKTQDTRHFTFINRTVRSTFAPPPRPPPRVQRSGAPPARAGSALTHAHSDARRGALPYIHMMRER